MDSNNFKLPSTELNQFSNRREKMGAEPPKIDAKQEAKPEVPKVDFGEKIRVAKEQGRAQFAAGIENAKTRFNKLLEKIRTLPADIGKAVMDGLSTMAAEANALPARIESAVDAMKQKVEAIETSVKAKIESEKAKFELKKRERMNQAIAVINRIQESAGSFFSRVKESLFANSRKREKEEFIQMIKEYIDYCEKNNIAVTDEKFKNACDNIVKIQEKHRAEAKKLGGFWNKLIRTKLVFVPINGQATAIA